MDEKSKIKFFYASRDEHPDWSGWCYRISGNGVFDSNPFDNLTSAIDDFVFNHLKRGAIPPKEISPETDRAMRILKDVMNSLPDDYQYEIFQYDNRIIYTLIRDGRDYKFEIGWYVEDVNRVKVEHLGQCLKDKIAIMESVDHEPDEDEYSWAFMPLDYLE